MWIYMQKLRLCVHFLSFSGYAYEHTILGGYLHGNGEIRSPFIHVEFFEQFKLLCLKPRDTHWRDA